MDEEQTIDLKLLARIALDNKIKLLKIIGACVLAALILAFVIPKQYTSSMLLKGKAPQSGGGFALQTAAVMAILGGSSSSANLMSYQEMLKSRRVIEPVIARLDLPDEQKANMTVEGFTKAHLAMNNPRGTDILEIRVTGSTPEDAQTIAKNVLDSFQRALTDLNQSEQSMQLKFLSGRLDVASEEMTQAEKKLEEFRQQSKIYVPTEQARVNIEVLGEYDRRMAELQVANQTNIAKVQGIDSQLRKQNVSLVKYNIAENTIVNKIREAIVDNQVRLINLEQLYTDKHPSVIRAREEVAMLSATLREEIANSIKAETNVLNPVHGYLLQEKAAAEAGCIATAAAIAALRESQAEIEAKISDLSANSLTYIALERKARMAQEVYKVLVTNYEQTRIQEAMESMAIQIVDEPDLPKGHSWPRRTLFVIIGGIMGMMGALTYLAFLYRKQQLA